MVIFIIFFSAKNILLPMKDTKEKNQQTSEFKVAKYWEKIRDNVVRCNLCPHQCVLQDEQIGLCKSRKNIKGTLYTLNYNKPVAVHIDPIEKKPLYHFLPSSQIFSLGTAGCNFSCLNCQNWEISQICPLNIRSYYFTPEEIIRMVKESGCKSIAFTYTEPTVFYEYMYDICVLAKKENIRTVIVSNGYINEKPLLDLIPYLDAANIDLKSFSDEIYRNLNGGTLHPVLRTLKILKEHKIWVEITNLIVPQYTDNLNMIEEMVKWLVDNGFSETPLHFSRFFPAYKLSHLPPTPVEKIYKAIEIAKKAGIKYVYGGNLREEVNTYCPNCKSLLIKRIGYGVKIENLTKEGSCKNCNYKIAGVWE